MMTNRAPLLKWSEGTWSRWSAMPRLSLSAIPRTKFILLKVPMSTVYEEKYGDRNVFTVPMYVQRLIAKGIAVGLVIDCTAIDLDSFDCENKRNFGQGGREGGDLNHYYFHNVDEWSDFGIDYYKLAADPHERNREERGENPTGRISLHVIQRFLHVCLEFWKEHPTLHISVFDARGGSGAAAFLTAYYLCHKWKAPVHTALTLIEHAAPQSSSNICSQMKGLYDIELMKQLQETFKGKKDIKVDYSKYPEWWFGTEDRKPLNTDGVLIIPSFVDTTAIKTKKDDDGSLESKVNDSSLSSSLAQDESHQRKKPKLEKYEPMFQCDDLEALPPNVDRFIRAVTVLKELTNNQATSAVDKLLYRVESNLDEQTLSKMQLGRCMITWKPVGRRGFLLILMDGIYFLENIEYDSKLQVSLVKSPLYIPNPQNPSSLQHRTLLDATLVMDGIEPRFFISDILVHMGGTLLNKPFHKRLKYLMEGVILARKRSAKIWDYSSEKVRIRAKEYFELEKIDFLLNQVMTAQKHEASSLEVVMLDGFYLFDNDRGGKCVFYVNTGDEAMIKKMVAHVKRLMIKKEPSLR
jgi:mRNA capping enzyme, catalytic domain.